MSIPTILFMQKVIKMKSKNKRQMAIYDILDWLEKEGSENIHSFWRCVFKEIILNKYSVLQKMHESLLDGEMLRKHNLNLIVRNKRKK